MLKTWFMALRAYSFPASVIPAALGGVIALWMRSQGLVRFEFNTLNFLLTILGSVSIHAVTNLVNDYYDYKNKLDTKENFGAMNVLVQGTVSPSQVRKAFVICFALSVLIGLYLIIDAGEKRTVLLLLVLTGAFSAYFYTAPPFSLKYRGLGDIQVILSFAVLMVFGSYYVQTGQFSWLPILYAIPIGLLVDDILHLNNLRDIVTDKNAGITTVAIRLGEEGSKRFHCVLSFGAFFLVVALILFAGMTPYALLTLLTFPLALKLAKGVQAMPRPDVITPVLEQTVVLHAGFGFLMIAGFIIATALK